VSGELVGHGPARFRNEPNGAPSYFITVRTDRGERTLWGHEIKRALDDSRTKPKPGDQVGVRENGIDPMMFLLRERNDRGHVINEWRADTPRPHWIIEKREFFNERAAAAKVLRDPRTLRHEAIRNHPELDGAYWALDGAVKTAAKLNLDPASRERFVDMVREALAFTTERGVPLPKEIPTHVPSRAPRAQRDDDRTR
jgi:putative DNA primase/helicase